MNVEIRIDLHFPTDASREMYIVVVISKIRKFAGNIKTGYDARWGSHQNISTLISIKFKYRRFN